MTPIGATRIFRGLSKKYKSEEVGKRQPGPLVATDFTDCPYTALQYARGANGMVLVLDIPPEALDGHSSQSIRVSKEFWLVNAGGPERYMVWGRFDDILLAEIPAKLLRAEIRRKGVRGQSEQFKKSVLKQFIEKYLHD
jgi:hypothetical protein